MGSASNTYLVVTDRGGHLDDALYLIKQIGVLPQALITTHGPDVDYLKEGGYLGSCKIYSIPMAFFWLGKRRIFNPAVLMLQAIKVILLFLQYRSPYIVSTGASLAVVPCYIARCLGAKIIHVENLNQVIRPSLTGRFLYPIASHFYVQWPDLLKCYGEKAVYAGNVI